jgi:fructosamine-3-kinase
MSLGPVELLVIKFPGNQFTGEIVPALKELVDSGTIRVIDLIFARKDKDGNVLVLELNDLDDNDYASYNALVGDLSGTLTQDDVQQLAATLERNSSAGILLFENTWATRFRDAVLKAKGQLVLNERIPHSVIEQLIAG